MSSDILRIIEGGLNNDRRKIISYSNRLATRLEAEGNIQLARCIKEQIQNSNMRSSATADAMRMLPLDSDSKLQIVEVIPEDSTRTNIVLSDNVGRQVGDFIELVRHSDELEQAGVNMPKSMLLYGAPGCGKTSIAHYVSENTNLPLVVARLDGIVSSLLGSTAKNLRKIFSYASSMPCILFLDEFDAIAKARDDNHELGELKRVINSLLQNIDSMPTSCVLIAATNHPELLDKAVWRRFTTKIEVGMPDDEARKKIILDLTSGFSCTFVEDVQKMKTVCDLTKKMSPSDISTIFSKLKVKGIINGSKAIEYEDLLVTIFEFEGKDEAQDKLIMFLNTNGVSQAKIAQKLNVSARLVRNILSKK